MAPADCGTPVRPRASERDPVSSLVKGFATLRTVAELRRLLATCAGTAVRTRQRLTVTTRRAAIIQIAKIWQPGRDADYFFDPRPPPTTVTVADSAAPYCPTERAQAPRFIASAAVGLICARRPPLVPTQAQHQQAPVSAPSSRQRVTPDGNIRPVVENTVHEFIVPPGPPSGPPTRQASPCRDRERSSTR